MYWVNAPNSDAHYYYRTKWRMRPRLASHDHHDLRRRPRRWLGGRVDLNQQFAFNLHHIPRTILNYKCDVQDDSRIITMNGHRHAHTDRFSIWVKKQSGEVINACMTACRAIPRPTSASKSTARRAVS
jgi:hypothetical protein